MSAPSLIVADGRIFRTDQDRSPGKNAYEPNRTSDRESMRLWLLLSSFILISTPVVVLAQLDDREREIEMEQDRLEMNDREAEAKTAAEEARRTEAESHRLQRQLDDLRLKVKIAKEKAEQDVSKFEARRRFAEKSIKKFQGEISTLQRETKKLEDQTNKYNDAAKRAEDTAQFGKSELEKLKARHDALLKALNQRAAAAALSQAKLKKMKTDYERLRSENQKLETNLRRPASQTKARPAPRSTPH